MKPVVRYTYNDIERLSAILYSTPLRVTLPPDLQDFNHRTHYVKDGKLCEIDHAKKLLTWKQPMQYLKLWVIEYLGVTFKDFAPDLYAFMFHVRLEAVPLYVSDETLNYFGLVKWRLDIGK